MYPAHGDVTALFPNDPTPAPTFRPTAPGRNRRTADATGSVNFPTPSPSNPPTPPVAIARPVCPTSYRERVPPAMLVSCVKASRNPSSMVSLPISMANRVAPVTARASSGTPHSARPTIMDVNRPATARDSPAARNPPPGIAIRAANRPMLTPSSQRMLIRASRIWFP
jgi:hypothetical protein